MEDEEPHHRSSATTTTTTAATALYPTPLVSLAHLSSLYSTPSRRLSSHFRAPTDPLPASPPPPSVAWLSLQGRLVGAAAASSARAIRGNLSKQEAVAWELFSPIHRILIVAVVAAATANSQKFRQILQLQRSVELRDQVLLTMQQKLDDLCQKMNSMQEQPETCNHILLGGNDVSAIEGNHEYGGVLCKFKNKTFESVPESFNAVPHPTPLRDGSKNQGRRAPEKSDCEDEMFKMPNLNGAEQEERRMSDLSDWCSSVTSSGEIQLNTIAMGQEIYNLQKQCEEKDATIRELASLSHASESASSKRTAELEDIIKRKNMIITKLKKDTLVLEQKILHLTRLRRPSFSTSNTNNTQLPIMANNLLYDMDSTTSPSSSDSDCPAKLGRSQSGGTTNPQDQASAQDDEFSSSEGDHICSSLSSSSRSRTIQRTSSAKPPVSLPSSINEHLKQRSASPLKENFVNFREDSYALSRSRQTSKNYRRPDKAALQKRWT